MPNLAINALTAPDNYTTASTIDTGGWVDHFVLDVANQAIFWQMKQINNAPDKPSLSVWQNEVQMFPGSRTISRPGLTGARFRAANTAASLPVGVAQAVVTLEVVTTT